MRGALAPVAFFLPLLSCTSVDYAGESEIIETYRVTDKNYVVGQDMVASLGEDVIRVRDFVAARVGTDQVEVTSSFRIADLQTEEVFRQDERYGYAGTVQYEGETHHVMYFLSGVGILFDDEGNVANRFVGGVGGPRGSPQMFSIGTLEVTPPGPHLRRIVSEQPDPRFPGIYYRLIFSGTTGDSMRFSVHEYTTDDHVRPATTLELVFPIETEEIRFRNFVIAVADITPSELRYRVVSDG
jgi:hypothetical protein